MGIVKEILNSATAASKADLKQLCVVLSNTTGTEFRIDGANGGYQLEGPNGKTYTGHIKANDLERFMNGFIAGYGFAKHPGKATGSQMATADGPEQESGNDDFDALVWGLTDEGVDDSFTGKNDNILYVRVDFDTETKQTLADAGFKDLADRFAGDILCFESGDIEDEPAHNYYATVTELEAEWTKAIVEAGGRAEETEDEGSEDSDADEDGDVDIDDVIFNVLDEENPPAPVDEVGDAEDENGYYAKYVFNPEFKARVAEYGEEFSTPLNEFAGVIVFYGKADGEDSQSLEYYNTPGELETAWSEKSE
jgi:hypothetical protein